jgi:hypothetical protein
MPKIHWRDDPREPGKLIGSINGLDLFGISTHVADTFMLHVHPTRSPVIGAPRNDPFATGSILDHHDPLTSVAEAKALAELKLHGFLSMIGAIFQDDAARLYAELDAAEKAWITERDRLRAAAALGTYDDELDDAEQEVWDKLIEIKDTLGLCNTASCRTFAAPNPACEEHGYAT